MAPAGRIRAPLGTCSSFSNLKNWVMQYTLFLTSLGHHSYKLKKKKEEKFKINEI